MPTIKAYFLDQYVALVENGETPTKMVVGVKLPTGATEIIINTDNIEDKLKYYDEKYNDDFELITNTDVKVIGVMFL